MGRSGRVGLALWVAAWVAANIVALAGAALDTSIGSTAGLKHSLSVGSTRLRFPVDAPVTTRFPLRLFLDARSVGAAADCVAAEDDAADCAAAVCRCQAKVNN